MISVLPACEQDVTRIVCPVCREKVKGVGLTKGSEVKGLTFRCRRCHRLWELVTDASGAAAKSNT